ncbi:3-isopropylmalate dehydratase small subunit [Dehalococcoidia bacterium]|nr:3-isopropylmalate dehydratase small subunit [Dehalococcoidia bacterium]
MEAFTRHTGVLAPLDRVNVDTDQIIPAEYLKRIERTGFGPFLFFAWRFLPDGSPNQDFELNRPGYGNASFLVVGRNFGSGSSREHAVWAITDYGIKAVIGSGLADIFHKNCFENGLVPVILTEEQVATLMTKAQADPGYSITVDLETCEVHDDQGLSFGFVVHHDQATHEFRRHCMLNGLDEIGLTMQHEDKITAYEERTGA